MSSAIAHTLARLPAFATLDYAATARQLRACLAQQARALDELAALPQPSYATLVAPLERLAIEREHIFGPLSHLHNVADNPELRAVYGECIAALSSFDAAMHQHAPLCRAYQRLAASPAFAELAGEERASVDLALRDFRLGGVDLMADQQARVKSLKVDLAELETQFGQRVLDATEAFTLDVDVPSRLAGLPETALGLTRVRAERAGIKAWRLTLDQPCYLPAMANLHDRELRRTLYEAYTTRASEQGPHAGRFDNSATMHAVLSKRRELACALGFANFAELSLATKMAPSVAAVETFLDQLARAARPHAARELAELRTFAATEFGLTTLEAWDVAFCAEQLRQRRLHLDQEALRPYFPWPRVRAGLFEICARVFGVRCESRGAVETWHSDIEFHAVLDHDGRTLGFFYFDVFARHGKRPGAWMDSCLTRFADADELQLPVAYLNCNFSPPETARASLLTHDEVTTLFHEFGHGLHHLLTRVDRPAVAGINGVAWDAIELPSQFFENWCWERAALDLLAGHHESGAKLPDDLLARLRESRRFHAALATLRQVEFALFDLRLHRDFDHGSDIQAILDAVRREVAVVTPPPWNRFQHSFSHIFAGGYAAGYYSYKWAEVLAADAFERFTEDGIFNRATGSAFRDAVLANGGARDAMSLFRQFRGRDPELAALLRQTGLAA